MEERRTIPDEKLEALLNRLRKNMPTTKCPSGNRITRLCTNSKCKSAIRCGDKNCKDCGKALHRICSLVPLEDMTDMLNDRAEECRNFIYKLFEIEQQFIESIEKRQKQFVDKYGFGNIKAQTVEIIKKIYDSEQYTVISGQQVEKMCEALEFEVEDRNINENARLEVYSQKLKKILKELQKYQVNCSSNSFKYQINIDSKILQQKGNQRQDIMYLSKVLNNPKKIQLLFRASQNEFKAAAFHEKCDNIEDTLVLIRTQYGKTIGGFTHYMWNIVKNGKYVSNSKRQTFLLQMDHHQKMEPLIDNNLIECRNNYGPCFGGGGPWQTSDIYLLDDCHISKTQAGACFPYIYNCEGPNKRVKNQQTYKWFSGTPNGYNFKVEQYQVFRVIYN